MPGERGHAGPDAADARRTDKYHLEPFGRAAELDFTIDGERLALTAVRVALDADVDEAERCLGRTLHLTREQDQARACPEDRLAGLVKLLQRRHEAPLVDQPEQRRGLAARHDEPVEAL